MGCLWRVGIRLNGRFWKDFDVSFLLTLKNDFGKKTGEPVNR